MRSSLHYEVVPRLARDFVEIPWQAVCQEEEETPPAMAGFFVFLEYMLCSYFCFIF